MSVATVQTASSSPTSPSSSSVTHTFSMPSDSRMRISSSLITCPFARSFFPPDRNTVQQRILPFELLTSTVCALMGAPQAKWIRIFDTRHLDESDYTDSECGPELIFSVYLSVNLGAGIVSLWWYEHA